MSSVRLTDWWRAGGLLRLNQLRRAASFRMALLFLALFGLISTALFVFLYLQMSAYALGRSDDWLVREHDGLMRDGLAGLANRVNYHIHLDPDNNRPFGLFSADGRRVAGTFPCRITHIPRYDQPFTLPATVSGHRHDLRVIAHLLPNRQVLILAQDMNALHEFDEVLLRGLAAAGGLALLMGLAGALLIGLNAVRRLDAITGAIQNIVSGDLRQRLPQRRPRASGDDLDRLVSVVNGMLDELERLMHEVKGVCDGIAHDLRTPLARLLGGLERAQRRATSTADYEQAVAAAIGDTLSLLATFNAMLRISEVEDGLRRAGFGATDLATIADDVVEFYEPSADDKQIRLSYQRNGVLALPLRGDASLLFEAVGNVLDNAIKFTPAGGQIQVRLIDAADTVALQFSDSGPGIPAAERDAVFRRFHRVEHSRHLPGNGLGLSLVAAVARLHGMTVTIADGGPGCTVTFLLPRHALAA